MRCTVWVCGCFVRVLIFSMCVICVCCLKLCFQAEFFSFYLSLLGVSFNSVYTQIWRVLLHLAADPFPEVSDLAMKVLNSIAYKVRYVRVFKAFITNCVLKTDFHLAQSHQSKNRITTFSWVDSKTWPVVSRQLQWFSLCLGTDCKYLWEPGYCFWSQDDYTSCQMEPSLSPNKCRWLRLISFTGR